MSDRKSQTTAKAVCDDGDGKTLIQSQEPSWRATVPSGWKLVPIEPTDAMIEEICCAMDRTDWPVHAKQAWDAVLRVIPEAKNNA